MTSSFRVTNVKRSSLGMPRFEVSRSAEKNKEVDDEIIELAQEAEIRKAKKAAIDPAAAEMIEEQAQELNEFL